jgi:DNA invertase Pin-like site-specific DNA recombinase
MVRGQKKFVAYYRVSTARQGVSGLGMEAQAASVEAFVRAREGRILASFVEVESGKHNDRPQLDAALARARAEKATLLIAKLDRLSRDALFLLTLQRADADFVAVDMPDANRLTIGIMALIAEHEREAISSRTKVALAAAKARGVRLGNPHGSPHLNANPAWRAKGQARAAKAVHEQANARARDLAPILEGAERRCEGRISDARSGLWQGLRARGRRRDPRGRGLTPISGCG